MDNLLKHVRHEVSLFISHKRIKYTSHNFDSSNISDKDNLAKFI